MDISQYESILKDMAIPPRPQVVTVLFEEMSRDVPDLGRISKTIASDPGLAGGILKAANSPLLGLKTKATSVSQAITLLGLRQASSIATGLAIRHSMGGRGAAMESFWNDTERVALIVAFLGRQESEAEIGAYVAKILHGVRSDEAYTYILFHDCGIPLLFQRSPRYLDALRDARKTPDGKPLRQIEEEFVGTHHGAVGYYLARSWGLPRDMCHAIFSHHDASVFDGDGGASHTTLNLIGIGHLAEYVHGARRRGVVEEEWALFEEPVMRHFSLDEEALVELADAVEAAGQAEDGALQ